MKVILVFGLFACCGCGEETNSTADGDGGEVDPPIPVAPADTTERELTVSDLHDKLKAKNPKYPRRGEFRKAGGQIRYAQLVQSGIIDVSPLKGLPLKYLDLTGNEVSDISALEGMPLDELYLENTKVADLSPLKDMPLTILRLESTPVADISPLAGLKLKQLNLLKTNVTDISAVSKMSLNTLWLTDTKVADLSPIEGKFLESLDVQNTPVSDLSVLSGMTTLKRLNIAGSAVSDLTPLMGLQLDRLIFTAERIKQGIEVVRNMPSLKQIGSTFETVTPAAQFWAKYDADKSE